MSQISEKQFKTLVPVIIASWFAGEKGQVEFEKRFKKSRTADLVQKIHGHVFVVEWKSSASQSMIAAAIKNLRELISSSETAEAIPLIAVPFMGESGRRLCAEQKISWLDLSGNADVTAPPGLRILIEGQPNKFKASGRPKNLFAPKSSRIAREFLMHPDAALTQRELTKRTHLNETLVGRVVRELERESLLMRDKESSAVRISEPDLLLDSWAENYNFDKHLVIHGFAAQRSGDATLRAVAEALEFNKIQYAATGLAGAWLLSHFASFRIATFYLKQIPSPELLKKLKITAQAEKGGNVWLVVPNDEGVFDDASKRDDICCAHPVQVYLDLKAHPERSREAAEEVRREYLNWRNQK